jgi:ACS family glucarate transporter-like MFS transporter
VNVSVVGVLLMKELALDQVQMGRVFSAFLLGYALMQVPAGMVADRWGARRVLMLAAWWWVGATLLQATAGWWPLLPGTGGALAVLLASRFVLGIGEAPTFTAAAEGISRWIARPYHARANGVVVAAVGLGSAIAPPLLTWAMLGIGWRGALAVSALPALVIALVWSFLPRRGLDARHAADVAPSPPAPGGVASGIPGPADPDAWLRPRGRRSQLALLTASYTLQGYVGYIFVFWFYLYLVQERHFDLLRGALLGSLPWILTIVSVPLGGMVADRLAARGAAGWRWRIVPVTGLVGAGIFISLGAHTGSAYVAALSLAAATGLVMCVEGPFWATMTRLSRGRAGTAGGVMNMGCNVGGLVSPALTPVIAAAIGWELALHVAAALSVAGGLLWFAIAPGRLDVPERDGIHP